METILPGWFVAHALIGIPIGYGLRVFEYVVWSGGQDRLVELPFRWSITLAPQCLVIGATLAYVSVVLLAPIIKNDAALSFTAYVLSGFWAFIALDVRNFIGRHK